MGKQPERKFRTCAKPDFEQGTRRTLFPTTPAFLSAVLVVAMSGCATAPDKPRCARWEQGEAIANGKLVPYCVEMGCGQGYRAVPTGSETDNGNFVRNAPSTPLVRCEK
jgi:hypothetical protein